VKKMPFGDRTGPLGRGPLTGRRAGYCAGFGVPGYANPAPGFGRGMGRGFGRGFGRGRGFKWRVTAFAPVFPQATTPNQTPFTQEPYQAPVSKQEEINALEQESKALEQELSEVKKRLNELKK
jgi:hypothetical protein